MNENEHVGFDETLTWLSGTSRRPPAQTKAMLRVAVNHESAE